MRSQCVQYVIAGHILILITNHIEVTSLGSFKMWAIFNWWAHCDYFVSVNTMSVRTTSAEWSSGEGLRLDAQKESQQTRRE